VGALVSTALKGGVIENSSCVTSVSYSKAINIQEKRTGSLFQKRFKRTIIEDKFSLVRAILYIHSNPSHHNIRNDFINYPYNSYKSMLSEKNTKLCRVEVLELFNG